MKELEVLLCEYSTELKPSVAKKKNGKKKALGDEKTVFAKAVQHTNLFRRCRITNQLGKEGNKSILSIFLKLIGKNSVFRRRRMKMMF